MRQTDAAELIAIEVFNTAQAAGEPVTMVLVKRHVTELLAHPPECECGRCEAAHLLTEGSQMPDYRITFFSSLRQEDDGLVHVRVEVELPVHPSYLNDAASGQTLAKDVGLDVTAKLMEKFEQLAAGPEAPA